MGPPSAICVADPAAPVAEAAVALARAVALLADAVVGVWGFLLVFGWTFAARCAVGLAAPVFGHLVLLSLLVEFVDQVAQERPAEHLQERQELGLGDDAVRVDPLVGSAVAVEEAVLAENPGQHVAAALGERLRRRDGHRGSRPSGCACVPWEGGRKSRRPGAKPPPWTPEAPPQRRERNRPTWSPPTPTIQRDRN